MTGKLDNGVLVWSALGTYACPGNVYGILTGMSWCLPCVSGIRRLGEGTLTGRTATAVRRLQSCVPSRFLICHARGTIVYRDHQRLIIGRLFGRTAVLSIQLSFHVGHG